MVRLKQEPPSDSTITSVRSGPEWRSYLLRLAAAERLSISALLDRAVTYYARSVEFAPPPKR